MEHRQASDDPEESSTPGGAYDTPDVGVNGLIGDGRYRVTRRLGRGGMAEVFAAEDVRLGRTVAVKLLRADLAEDPIAKARFTREAQSVAGLNHHAVVAVYDSGEDRIGTSTVPYIVMELVEGHTIRDLLINEDAPPVDQALAIVSGVLEALAYSHQHGIVHRDIKPANVIITTTGAVKVMDFGIARALHGASTTMTQTGMVMGTPQYLSPEQALGKTVDHRSDLYATGCLLYELLTLRPPFTGETPLSVVYQHVQDNPRIPSSVSDRVPPELDGLVLRSLAKNPDDRFQSAEEMYGLVQFALQMLSERGGWTGTWDTGYVDRSAASAAAATTALPHPQSGQTAELGPPLLMGPPQAGGNDGYGGYDRYDGYGGDGEGSHRGRTIALVLVVALLAVGLGVLIAVNTGNNGQDKGGPQPGSSSSVSASDSASDSSTPSDTSSPTDQFGSGGQSQYTAPPTTSGGGPYQPTSQPTTGSTPSSEPTPSASPSDTASSNPGGGTGSATPTPPLPSTTTGGGAGGLPGPTPTH